MFVFQTKGAGNCLFHVIQGCLRLRKSADKEAPFYPCRYLRRAVVAHMAHQRHRVMKHKGAALRSKYGVANNDLSDTPISYKQYLQFMLKSTTWGDDVVIYAISDLFKIKIISINASRLDEFRCRHNQTLRTVDTILIFNGSNHYSFAGKWSFVLLTGHFPWTFVVCQSFVTGNYITSLLLDVFQCK